MLEKYEAAKDSLSTLILEFNKIKGSDTVNEATTRFKLIDALLKDCLGWGQDDIEVEDYYNGDFSDYKLSLFRPVAIWEAKKIGNYFTVPAGIKNTIYPLKSLIKDNPNLKKALQQVTSYCNERGIQVGVVCNGWQIVAFIASRSDSIPPLEGDALVISSLEVFDTNFKEVWNYLSKSGFEENNLIRKLIGGAEKQLPQKLASTINAYPGVKNRNVFQNELEIISDLVLEDIIKDEVIEKDFLTECYCKSGALSQYSLVSKEILSTRYHYLFEPDDKKAVLEQVANKKGLSPELLELFANTFSKRPILLIGDVGVGKSTFIDNLVLIEAPTAFQKSFTFKIDLGSKAIIDIDIKRSVIKIIKEQLIEKYSIDIDEDDFVRHCYFVELEQFKKSVKVKRLYEIAIDKAIEKEVEYLTELVDDEASHLKKSLEYISKNQKKQIIIFIDNCDQRNDADQETAFLIAQEFAVNWKVLIFVSLRPETFHRTKKISGALSGYHTKAFTISPPRMDEVIDKRLTFARKISKGEINLSTVSIKTSFSKLDKLIESFQISLKVNPDLNKFLDNISNGNIRKSIELIKKFFGSGHVDTEKIIRIIEEDGSYIVPLHELLRSIIYGDNVYYSPTTSEIVNLFDVRNYDEKEHFIVPMLLGLLVDSSVNNRNSGFVSITECYNHLQASGFLPVQIDGALNFMYSKHLFETSQKGNALSTEILGVDIRVTGLGMYHLLCLIDNFTYIDAIVVDVPIFDSETKSNVHNYNSITQRLERAEIFTEYLDKVWGKSSFNDSYFNWPAFSTKISLDIQRIRGKANII